MRLLLRPRVRPDGCVVRAHSILNVEEDLEPMSCLDGVKDRANTAD